MKFSLGLETEKFLSPLHRAGEGVGFFTDKLKALGGPLGITGLVGSLVSLHEVIEKTFGKIEQGAGLVALSKQTTASVRDIFLIQKGFSGVHLSADMAGTAIFQMQRALGGVNDMGENTKDIFSKMGLSLADLKNDSVPEQLQKVFSGLDKLSPDAAAKASSSIFGRGIGQQMLQAARSGEEFTGAMKRATEQADIMAKNALGFEHVEQNIKRVKGRLDGFFLGLAEGAAPGILQLTDKINGIDLTKLGQKLGGTLAAVTQSFTDGTFSQGLELAFKAGIQGASNFMDTKIDEWLARLSGSGTGGSGNFWTGLRGVGLGLLGIGDLAGESLGLGNSKWLGGPNGETLSELAEKRIEAAQKAFQDAGWEGAISAVAGTKLGTNPFLDELLKWGAAEKAKALARTQGSEGERHSPPPSDQLPSLGRLHQTSVNDLERVGLVRLGGASRSDYAGQTARNTAKALDFHAQIVKGIDKLLEDRGHRYDFNNQ